MKKSWVIHIFNFFPFCYHKSACNVGALGSIPGLGRSPGEGKGYPLQYSGLENSMDCIVHGVTRNWTQLSNFHFRLIIQPLKEILFCGSSFRKSEKEMASHSSILVHRIPRSLVGYSPWGHKESDTTE